LKIIFPNFVAQVANINVHKNKKIKN